LEGEVLGTCLDEEVCEIPSPQYLTERLLAITEPLRASDHRWLSDEGRARRPREDIHSYRQPTLHAADLAGLRRLPMHSGDPISQFRGVKPVFCSGVNHDLLSLAGRALHPLNRPQIDSEDLGSPCGKNPLEAVDVELSVRNPASGDGFEALLPEDDRTGLLVPRNTAGVAPPSAPNIGVSPHESSGHGQPRFR
jgi:hypothetical protein